MSAALYFARYIETETTTESWPDWLVNVQSADPEPSELATITDVCASAKCKATLLDAAGFVRGSVDTDGNYRLQ